MGDGLGVAPRAVALLVELLTATPLVATEVELINGMPFEAVVFILFTLLNG